MIACTKCNIEQPVENFHKKKSKLNGLDPWCKSCKSIYRHNYFLLNIEKEKSRSREKAWITQGIILTHLEYVKECQIRENKCDICKKNNETLHVDHCHVSGKIRGYLCGACNKALGLFKDSTDNLKQAMEYLNEFKNLCNS